MVAQEGRFGGNGLFVTGSAGVLTLGKSPKFQGLLTDAGKERNQSHPKTWQKRRAAHPAGGPTAAIPKFPLPFREASPWRCPAPTPALRHPFPALPALPARLLSSADSSWPACREEAACAGAGPAPRLCRSCCQTAPRAAEPRGRAPRLLPAQTRRWEPARRDLPAPGSGSQGCSGAEPSPSRRTQSRLPLRS